MQSTGPHEVQVGPNHDAVADVVGVHHKQEDDAHEGVLDGSRKDEREGHHDGRERDPRFAHIHLHVDSRCQCFVQLSASSLGMQRRGSTVA